MTRTVKYFDELDLRWDKGEWLVLHEIGVLWLDGYKTLAWFRVAAGWHTDLASIPSLVPGFLFPQSGAHNLPAVVHDWTYEDNVPGMSRADADLLFLDGMAAQGVPWLRRRLMYRAVRVAGSSLWG